MNRSTSGLLENTSPDPGKGRKGGGFFRSLLRAPTFEDAAKNRVASLQYKILLAMITICLLAFTAFFLTWSAYPTPSGVRLTLFAIISLLSAFISMRRGYTEYVSW